MGRMQLSHAFGDLRSGQVGLRGPALDPFAQHSFDVIRQLTDFLQTRRVLRRIPCAFMSFCH